MILDPDEQQAATSDFGEAATEVNSSLNTGMSSPSPGPNNSQTEQLDSIIHDPSASAYDDSEEWADLQKTVAGGRRWKIKGSTQDHYAKIAKRVWRAAQDSYPRLDPLEPVSLAPLQVAQYLIDQVNSKSKSTWVAYRSALLWSFGGSLDVPEFAAAHQLLARFNHKELPGDLSAEKNREARDRSERKGVPRADITALLDTLGTMNRTVDWGTRLQYWIQAGLASGLRPAEWEEAVWGDAEQTFLLVNTSKTKEDVPAYARDAHLAAGGRPADPDSAPAKLQRVVHIAPKERLLVDLHMNAIRSSGLAFDAYYRTARQVLWRACTRTFKNKKTYSLYNFRHQFSANIKAVMEAEDVAAAMGHTSLRSRYMYAPRWEATRGVRGGRRGAAKETDAQKPLEFGGEAAAAHAAEQPGSGGGAPASNAPAADVGAGQEGGGAN